MKKLGIVFVFLALFLSLVPSARGDTITYYTPPGTLVPPPPSTSGEFINATALFTTSINSITVVLNNLFANPKADTALISGIRFSVSGTPGEATNASTATTKIPIGSGLITNIAGGGAYSPSPGTLESPLLNSWGVNQWPTNMSTFDLDIWAAKPSGSGPTHQIIGPDANGNFTYALGTDAGYTQANTSITGKDPQVLGTATFVIPFSSGVDASSTISNVYFLFGTIDSLVVGQPPGTNTVVGVPEPASMLLFGSGLIGAAAVIRRRFKR